MIYNSITVKQIIFRVIQDDQTSDRCGEVTWPQRRMAFFATWQSHSAPLDSDSPMFRLPRRTRDPLVHSHRSESSVRMLLFPRVPTIRLNLARSLTYFRYLFQVLHSGPVYLVRAVLHPNASVLSHWRNNCSMIILQMFVYTIIHTKSKSGVVLSKPPCLVYNYSTTRTNNSPLVFY